ncbi:MAG: hypothetical protein HFJ36_06110 [Clostridia bacterium]|nr:hypothetical protein [Clostridia bacterium]
MKIQNLAIIFIVIMLPISMVLTSFVQNQVETLHNQISYDTKLNRATYDALKAFQLNTINNDTSDLTNSKLRDIEASANTFFNSISSNFNMAGYNKDVLKSYVPALVYTMYDGYYIYSPYNNVLDDNKVNEVLQDDGTKLKKSDKEILEQNPDATYKDGDKIYGLKPYIHYSCRYIKGASIDVVITYSLDSFITVQGTVDGKNVFKYGYLLDEVYANKTDNDRTATYRGVPINCNEETKEYIDQTDTEYTYIKLNGVKYYKDNNGKWFSILNNERYVQDNFNPETTGAFEYYNEAYQFTEWLKNSSLKELTGADAVNEYGNELSEEDKNKLGNYKIFEFKDSSGINIEDKNSNFTQQRLAVIRYSIEKNLSVAIANYNNYTGVKTEFQMPKLKEDEWEQILNNVSIISFMQGLSIGGKIYNGYSIITNNKNKETVNEDSIYIVSHKTDGYYHRPNCRNLIDKDSLEGILNIDVERKTRIYKDGEPVHYFYPKKFIGCYDCAITYTNVEHVDDLGKYMAEEVYNRDSTYGPLLAQTYFTALGRERYGLYRTNTNPDAIKGKFGITNNN